MSKTYMNEVASLLGVELEEEVRIVNKDCVELCNMPCRITVNGLIDKKGEPRFHALSKLLEGEYKIVKMPWKPHDSDKFFYITMSDDIVEKEYVKIIPYDCTLIRMGNYFKTKEEAESHKEKWLKYFWQEPDLSWRNNNE